MTFRSPVISSIPHHSHVLCFSHSELPTLLLTHHIYSSCHTFILLVFSIWSDLLHTFQEPIQVSLPLHWQLIISCSFPLCNFYIYLYSYLVPFISTLLFFTTLREPQGGKANCILESQEGIQRGEDIWLASWRMNRSLLVRKKDSRCPTQFQSKLPAGKFLYYFCHNPISLHGVSPYKTVGSWGQKMCLVSLQCSAPQHTLGIIDTFLSQGMKIWNYQSSIYLSLCLHANWEKNISLLNWEKNISTVTGYKYRLRDTENILWIVCSFEPNWRSCLPSGH